MIENALDESDEALREALGRSSKAIGLKEFCRWVEGEYKRCSEEQGQPVDVAMRRIEVGVEPPRVLREVCKHFGVDESELRERRYESDGRMVAMSLLRDYCGMTQREVALELGLKDGSGVSRKLVLFSSCLTKNRKLKKAYVRLRDKLLNHKA